MGAELSGREKELVNFTTIPPQSAPLCTLSFSDTSKAVAEPHHAAPAWVGGVSGNEETQPFSLSMV